MKKKCSIEECTALNHARGWCAIHYQNWKRNGVPRPLVEQFWGSQEDRLAKFSIRDGECLRWTKKHDADGYGQVRHDGQMRRVHRVAYTLAHGPVPDGLEVDHICHTRDCLNLEHLRLLAHKHNAENRSGLRSTNTTGATGVHRHGDGKYQASVRHNGTRYHVGTFETVEEAGAAATAKRNELFTHNDIDRHFDA